MRLLPLCSFQMSLQPRGRERRPVWPQAPTQPVLLWGWGHRQDAVPRSWVLRVLQVALKANPCPGSPHRKPSCIACLPTHRPLDPGLPWEYFLHSSAGPSLPTSWTQADEGWSRLCHHAISLGKNSEPSQTLVQGIASGLDMAIVNRGGHVGQVLRMNP